MDSAHVGTVGDVIPNLMFRVLLDEHRPSFGERAVLVVTVFESLANDDCGETSSVFRTQCTRFKMIPCTSTNARLDWN